MCCIVRRILWRQRGAYDILKIFKEKYTNKNVEKQMGDL